MGTPGELTYELLPMVEGEAVELFADRARLLHADFKVDDGNRGLVAQIVERLERIPLAIEVAAARIDVLGLDGIARRIGDALAVPALRAAIEWSWELLDGSPYHSYRTEDLAVVDPEAGWGVDGDGRVHRTTDGGETWAQTTTLPVYLRSVEFVSRSRGWAGTIGTTGTDRKLYETRNGGLTFQDVSHRLAGRISGVCSLFAVDEHFVYWTSWDRGTVSRVPK